MKQTIFTRWIKELEVPATKRYASNLYENHPYKYTLYGLSQMLSEYNIANECLRIEKKENLFELQTPFLAGFANDFVLVKEVNKDSVVYEWYGENITIKSPDFLHGWSGVVLLAYPDENSGEPEYKKHKREEFVHKAEYALIGVCFALFYFYAFFSKKEAFENSQFLKFVIGALTNGIGLYVSYLLLLKQLHIQSHIADRICNVMKKSSCNDVLDSNAAKVFDRIGWSEIGTAYFSVNLCVTAFVPQWENSLAVLSACSLGYVAWSIWYQRFKAHSWCPLCLIVQGVFVVQCAGYAFTYAWGMLPNWEFIVLFGCYALVLLSLNKLLPTIVSAQKEAQLSFSFNNLKAQEKVFRALQDSQETFPTDGASTLFFGAENAKITITVFSNPYCNPCAAMHKRLEAMVSRHCRILYVFTSFSEDLTDINRYIIAAYQTFGPERTWRILSDWFEGGKNRQEKFFASMNLNIESGDVAQELERHQKWKETTKFDVTPTVLVNGQKLAYPYQLEDMLMFLE